MNYTHASNHKAGRTRNTLTHKVLILFLAVSILVRPLIAIRAYQEVGVRPETKAVVKDDGEPEVEPDDGDAKAAVDDDEGMDTTDPRRVLQEESCGTPATSREEGEAPAKFCREWEFPNFTRVSARPANVLWNYFTVGYKPSSKRNFRIGYLLPTRNFTVGYKSTIGKSYVPVAWCGPARKTVGRETFAF